MLLGHNKNCAIERIHHFPISFRKENFTPDLGSLITAVWNVFTHVWIASTSCIERIPSFFAGAIHTIIFNQLYL